MKIISANNGFTIEMSDAEWREIGAKNNWVRTAQLNDPDLYQNECKVSIYLPNNLPNRENLDIGDAKTIVKFAIDIEARSWGIKDISLHLRAIDPIYAELIDMSGPEDKTSQITINVDASQLKQEVSGGASITTGSMTLYLLPDMTVDYKRSWIDVYNLQAAY